MRELIDLLLKTDLKEIAPQASRRQVLLGHDSNGAPVNISTHGACILVAGPSGSGKSTAVTAIVERLQERGYQICLIDPEGDFENFPGAVCVGNEKLAPNVDEFVQLMERYENVVLNLLGVSLADRPEFFAGVLGRIQDLRVRTGRPHWLVMDEVHHLLPESWRPAPLAVPQMLESAIMITVHPEHVSPAVLAAVDTVLAVGISPQETLSSFSSALGEATPSMPGFGELGKQEVLAWFRNSSSPSLRVLVEPGSAERRRHRRKYAQGDIQEKSFYFRGPEGKLNLRANNLMLFVQIAEGVDDDTWLHHLRQGDYSRWVRQAIKDKALAEEIESIESANLSAEDSRAGIKDAIQRQYTGAA